MGLHFSKEEFSRRKNQVLSEMKKQHIDALLMFRQDQCIGLQVMILLDMFFFKL